VLTVAALYVDPCGVYSRIPGVDPWGLPDRDARGYEGPHPVVAHPPCASWGRYAKPHPGSKARGPLLGDDGDCFINALVAVRCFGGVLEHPKDSKAWARFGLATPTPGGGWSGSELDGWVCEIDQGHYGHAARKPTWLYFIGPTPPDLVWGPSSPPAIGSGARRGNLESLSKKQRAATPRPFADLLVSLARRSQE
jgi:hypothetical protein